MCGEALNCRADLVLDRVPAGVQWFPSAEELVADTPVSLRVHTCRGCGLLQLPGASAICLAGETSASSCSPFMMAHRRTQIEEFIDRYGLVGKPVLDAGCGDGHLLEVLAAAGVQAVGVEPSKGAVKTGRSLGRNIHLGWIAPDSAVEGGPFAAFVCIHVLEHVPAPGDFLLGLAANLVDSGVGLLEVPSLEQIVSKRRPFDFIADHLSYFSAQTLAGACERSGFVVEELRRDLHGEHLVAQVRREPGTQLSGLEAAGMSLCREFENSVSDAAVRGGRVVVWGASHTALTLLASCDCEGIEYVVDSAGYKQGRFTPVSHLPIHPPSRLRELPPRLVFVIAPRYTVEICRQLREDIGFSGAVAVVDDDNIRFVE